MTSSQATEIADEALDQAQGGGLGKLESKAPKETPSQLQFSSAMNVTADPLD